MSDIEHIMETALRHQQAGELAEAAGIYRKVLEIEPAQADALHLLGMVAHAQQDNEQAIELINKAILLDPLVADFHINAASVYLALGKTAAAGIGDGALVIGGVAVVGGADSVGLHRLGRGHVKGEV